MKVRAGRPKECQWGNRYWVTGILTGIASVSPELPAVLGLRLSQTSARQGAESQAADAKHRRPRNRQDSPGAVGAASLRPFLNEGLAERPQAVLVRSNRIRRRCHEASNVRAGWVR